MNEALPISQTRLAKITRDVFYFSNANTEDVLNYWLIHSQEMEVLVKAEALISNKFTSASRALVRMTKMIDG